MSKMRLNTTKNPAICAMAWVALNLGVIYAKVENYKDANSYFGRACDLRNAEGCLNLGISYAYGYGVSVCRLLAQSCDLRKRESCMMDACDKQNDALACQSVAQFYSEGIGVEIDEKISEIYLKKACEMDNDLCE